MGDPEVFWLKPVGKGDLRLHHCQVRARGPDDGLQEDSKEPMEDVSLDISHLTGITGEKDQKVVAKLDMSNLTKFKFGTVSGNTKNFSRWMERLRRELSDIHQKKW